MADRYREGDLIIGLSGGHLLHVPQADLLVANDAVSHSVEAFDLMKTVSSEQISQFFHAFAQKLEDDAIFAKMKTCNEDDVASALQRGRSTTRLMLTDAMRSDMISALHTWGDTPHVDGAALESVDHSGWSVSSSKSSLGVVAFVFEGRPNVFADATGVLRSGNTCVFRIGSDALGTAQAIMNLAVLPALESCGLPVGAVSLVDSRSHASGWALFSDKRVSLAIARGSGEAVSQLGAVARQFGIAVSLHGTGGAWMIAGEHADAQWLSKVVVNSLDRKVCNTLNVCCIVRSRAGELVPLFVDAMKQAAKQRNAIAVIHADAASQKLMAEQINSLEVHNLSVDELGTEWEWENAPECSLVIVNDVDEAIALFNQYAPSFIVSIISDNEAELEQVWRDTNAPFVSNGMTRWVDGQFALNKPELGLSNWQNGRTLGRGGILSGDSVFSVRYRVLQHDADLHR
ncbi:MAG: aldehyde dehydrogenase family protein [Actinobacteria bacterium]|nr:MAG: aldehyde dehydrogenase family protein [Actinomycetota bacterium]